MIVTVTLNTSVDRVLAVPNFQVGSHTKGALVGTLPAGKGVNVSRCLSTLGYASRATGFVGEADERLFVESFVDTKVKPSFVTVSGATRLDTTVLDHVGRTETHIREEGFEVKARDLARLGRKLDELVSPGDLVVFCGSLPPGVTAAAFRELLGACKAQGAKAAVDSSGLALASAIKDGVFLVKPNLDEMSTLAGKRLSLWAEACVAADRLLNKVDVILVSLGPEGVLGVTREGCWRARCRVPQRDVVSTVGCGDALLAGYLADHVEGEPPSECLRLAVACGAACALTPLAGVIRMSDVRRFTREARVWAV
ncbi:MAG: 1-phosphofructokinase family hexose kinase [Planctomycetes bacterium]|nr:1-phosphofructokinase family hexose kinase [Planctomycetota bacterium]